MENITTLLLPSLHICDVKSTALSIFDDGISSVVSIAGQAVACLNLVNNDKIVEVSNVTLSTASTIPFLISL